MLQKTFRYCSTLLVSLCSLVAVAQIDDRTPRPTPPEMRVQEKVDTVPLFCGISVATDMVGLVMKPFGGDYFQPEVAAKVYLKDRYIPVVECGFAHVDHVDEETGKQFKTQAPYFRVGIDYNFTKRKLTGNRLYAGVRYAFTSYKYDLYDPTYADPVWGSNVPLNATDLKGRMQWAEVVFGLEAKIWSLFRLGWSVRYKARINSKEDVLGGPWYVPGFGKYDKNCLGGTFHVIFEI